MIAGIVAAGRPLSAQVAAGPAAARYWRVYITAVRSGNYAGLAEVKMRAPGGAVISVGGTPAASSALGGLFTASQAFDGLADAGHNGWLTSNTAPPHWIAYDFGSAKSVGSLEIIAYNATMNSHLNDLKDFQLQSSDDNVAWVTVGTFSTNPIWTDFESRTFNP